MGRSAAGFDEEENGSAFGGPPPKSKISALVAMLNASQWLQVAMAYLASHHPKSRSIDRAHSVQN